MNSEPIICEQILNVPPSKVWKAITERDEMSFWYFDLEEFIPEVGFDFRFTGGPDPETQYVHHCEITKVIQEKILTYSWRYEGYEGKSFVTFELFPQGSGTLLKLIHSGIETFPKEISDFDRENFVVGWDHIIHTSLKEYLEPEE